MFSQKSATCSIKLLDSLQMIQLHTWLLNQTAMRLRRRKPRVLLTLPQMLLMWISHLRSSLIVNLLPDILPYQQIPRHDREGNI
jgi:hypothetical protein